MVPDYALRGDGSPTLMFLHGIGGDWRSFAPQLDTLSDWFRCVSWTMPGYGKSPKLTPMTFPGLAERAVDLLDAVGCEKAVIVGQSMGGMVAQEMALRFPQRVAALVAVCTSPSFGKAGSDFNKNFLAARLAPIKAGETPADIAEGLVDGMVGAAAPETARALAVASMSQIAPDAYQAALECLVTFNRRAELGEIACPALMIAGSEDRTAPPKIMQFMADQIPDASYLCIEGAGHLANLEQPDAFNRAVSDFVVSLGTR